MSTPDLTIEQFNALPDRKKRIAVALDVVNHLLRYPENVVIQCGRFYSSDPNTIFPAEEHVIERENLIDLESRPPCAVCAVGACLLSAIRLMNGFSMYGSILNFDPVHNVLRHAGFPDDQIVLIECAFEQGEGFFFADSIVSDHGLIPPMDGEMDRAAAFGQSYDDPTLRLIAIMDNILKHDGTFCPGDI